MKKNKEDKKLEKKFVEKKKKKLYEFHRNFDVSRITRLSENLVIE